MTTPPTMTMEEVSAARSETGQDELYLVLDGVRVAYRADGKWNSLRPDIEIVEEARGLPDDCEITDGGEVQLFPEPETDTRQ